MSSVGMRNSLSPPKPTTSASTVRPSAASMRQRPPTAASQPMASSVMPTIRLSVPSTIEPAQRLDALASRDDLIDPASLACGAHAVNSVVFMQRAADSMSLGPGSPFATAVNTIPVGCGKNVLFFTIPKGLPGPSARRYVALPLSPLN